MFSNLAHLENLVEIPVQDEKNSLLCRYALLATRSACPIGSTPARPSTVSSVT